VCETEAKVTQSAIVAEVRAYEKKPVEHKLSRALAVTAARYMAAAARAYLGKEKAEKELHGAPSGLGELETSAKRLCLSFAP